jgi:diguanylate cyclase (GGDEF)-like protein
MERLQQEWARMVRYGGQLSFIMADIDHFKRINDAYGHNIGDRMLQAVADCITGKCRKTDLPSRCGGEEFAIVVPGEKASSAAILAERCRQEIEAIHLTAADQTVRTTASFGVADSTGLPSPEALIAQADAALYQAKGAGRNGVRVCAEGNETQTQKNDQTPKSQ